MNKYLKLFFIIAVMAFVACKNDNKTVAASEAPTIIHKSIQKRQVDAEGKTTRMLDYLISYPSVEKGSDGLKLAVKSTVLPAKLSSLKFLMLQVIVHTGTE